MSICRSDLSIVSQKRTAFMSTAVERLEPGRYVAWSSAVLRKTLSRNADLRSALQILISKDLAAKLSEGAWDALSAS
jgi:hypothetical protein